MKSKWINLTCRITPQEIVNSMLRYPISDSVEYGFDVLEQDDCKIEASYYEKQINKQSFRLPNGELIESESLSITIFDFVLYKLDSDIYLVCLKCPPRSLRSFIDKLEETLAKPIYISNLTINIPNFIDEILTSEVTTQVTINEISAIDLVFDDKSTGEVKIKSRSNALDVLKAKFNGGNLLLKSCKLSCYVNGKKVITKVTQSGSIECSNIFQDYLFSIISNIR